MQKKHLSKLYHYETNTLTIARPTSHQSIFLLLDSVTRDTLGLLITSSQLSINTCLFADHRMSASIVNLASKRGVDFLLLIKGDFR